MEKRIVCPKRLRIIREFCLVFNDFCKRYNITIEQVHRSMNTETRYYTLWKSKKRCKVRISCHLERKGVVQNPFEFNLVQGRSLCAELEALCRFLDVAIVPTI